MSVAEATPAVAQERRPLKAVPPAPGVQPVDRAKRATERRRLPPSNGAPAAARAGTAIGDADAKPDVASRAKMSAGLQQNVGNARMGAMVGEAAAPAPAAKEKGAAPKEAAGAAAAIAPAVTAVHDRAKHARKHAPPAKLVDSAHAAAREPKTEQTRAAAVKTVVALDAVDAEKVRRDTFKAKLKAAIEHETPQPKTQDEAAETMKSGAAKASTTMRVALAAESNAATGPLESAAQHEASPAEQPAPPKAELKGEAVGAPPAPVSADPVVPPPLPAERFDYSPDRGETDAAMADAGVTTEQLAKGNEPAFAETLEARGAAEKHEAQAQTTYRKSETDIRGETATAAQANLAKELGGFHGLRARQVGKVSDKQAAARAKEAEERQRVTDTITGFKNATRADVEKILTAMESEASSIFEAGLALAEKAYEETFSEKKGNYFVTAWLHWENWEEHVARALAIARDEYLHQVDVAIDRVSAYVDAQLLAAKNRVAEGRRQVQNYVDSLDANLRGFGKEALEKVSADFDAMTSDIDQRADKLVAKLTQQFKSSQERMTAREEQLRAENRSLWDKIRDATVGVIKQILAFKDMLLGVLAKAAAVISDIMADPIGFLGHLIDAVMTGLNNFMANIGTHLMKGLMSWLFGAIGSGLTIPQKFDLEGIISLILQVLGLTKENFRARAVAIVGEQVVSAIEELANIFLTLKSEGVAGLWKYLKEKLEELKSMVLDGIFDYIKEAIFEAGITWLISLLNPASAFFKACKAIYDIIKFFVERGSQILALVNAVIDSVTAIAKGAIDSAAKKVEEALANAIPVAIGFLAALLSLGNITDAIQGIIEKARKPVNKAIDWVINTAVKLVKSAGKLFKKKEAGTPAGVPEDPAVAAKGAKVDALIDAADAKYMDHEGISEENAHKVEREVQAKVPEIKRMTLIELEHDWVFHFEMSPGQEKKVPKPKKGECEKIRPTRPTFSSTTKSKLREMYKDRHKYTTGKSYALAKSDDGESQDRRHIIASNTMITYTTDNLKDLTLAAAAKRIGGKLAKAGAGSADVKPKEREVQDAAQALAKAFFNDVENLWIGGASENRSLGDKDDPPKYPEEYKAAQGIEYSESTHRSKMQGRYYI